MTHITIYYKLLQMKVTILHKLSISMVRCLTPALDVEYFAKNSHNEASCFFNCMTLTFQNIQNSD